MAAPRDNIDEEMMNIINTGTQFVDGDQQDVDDGSQYLALEDNQENIVQENTGKVYIFIYIFEYLSSIMCTHDIYLFFFLYIALWIDDHNGENIQGPKKPLEGRYIISEFNIETGEPLGPHARKFVQHCGYLVRDRLPISAREWKQKINEPHVSSLILIRIYLG